MLSVDADRYKYDYNREEIEKRIKKLCSVARELDMSILPYVNDTQGRFSSRKAMKFINDLLRASLCRGKEAEFYKAFLYCSLRCCANESMYIYDMLDEFRICSTFQDILDKAAIADMDSKLNWLKDRSSLMLYEYQEMEEYPGGNSEKGSFFIMADKCYEWVTEKSYTTIDAEEFEGFFTKEFEDYREMQYQVLSETARQLDEENEREARENGFDSYEEYEADLEKKAKEAGFDQLGDYLYDLYLQGLSDEEREEIEKEQQSDEEYWNNVELLNKDRRPAWEEYRKGFADIDKFVEMYRKYRTLYFEVEHKELYKRVEYMINMYMYSHGLSVCSSDEAVLNEIAVLEDITAQLDAAIKRSRKRNGL